jgi:hypothetical protein
LVQLIVEKQTGLDGQKLVLRSVQVKRLLPLVP